MVRDALNAARVPVHGYGESGPRPATMQPAHSHDLLGGGAGHDTLSTGSAGKPP